MKYLWLLLVLLPFKAWAAACPVTTGGLTLSVSQPRTSGISPFLAFFDASASSTTNTLPGAGTVVQDVYFAWSFGDPNASGTGTWAYGARPNLNSRNVQNGGIVAAHLYVLPTAGTTDTNYTVQVWAYDGTSIATCTVSATAFAPSGTNGFPGNSTACVAAATLPVAGSGGCPAGAGVVPNQPNAATALTNNLFNGKRILFKCGDTFNGTYTMPATLTKAMVGAYGGCENTTTSRPIWNTTGTAISVTPNNPTDIRITDIDFEDGTHAGHAFGSGGGLGETRFTMYNLNCNGMNTCYALNQAAESGLIASVQTGMNTQIGSYWNFGANNCLNLSTALNCGGTPAYFSVSYNAILGDSFDGTGGTGLIETFRTSACRFCVLANNNFKNSPGTTAQLKFNSANTFNSQATWIGQYTEYVEISDNYFTGPSGGWNAEIASENTAYDERERFLVFERNFFFGTTKAKVLVAATNSSVRNNVFYFAPGNTSNYGIQVAARGTEPTPTGVEVYNNTCYARATMTTCVGFLTGDGAGGAGGTSSFAQNNLFYNNGVNNVTVSGTTGNTVNSNTANSATNPTITNSSTTFTNLGDFKPTAAFSGGACTPNWFDAFNLSRVGACTQIGAVSQAAPAQ